MNKCRQQSSSYISLRLESGEVDVEESAVDFSVDVVDGVEVGPSSVVEDGSVLVADLSGASNRLVNSEVEDSEILGLEVEVVELAVDFLRLLIRVVVLNGHSDAHLSLDHLRLSLTLVVNHLRSVVEELCLVGVVGVVEVNDLIAVLKSNTEREGRRK